MTLRLTAEAARELTRRWHDQTLDVEELRFDKAKGECVFSVTEPIECDHAVSPCFLQQKVLRRCTVTVSNVSNVQILDAEGEVELYVNEVESGPDRLVVKCVNGTVELRGGEMEMRLEPEVVARGDTGQKQVTLATPVGDLSWRRRHTKGKP